MKLKDLLTKKLTKKEMEFLKTSFDTIGDVAIIEIPDELEKKEKEIEKTFFRSYPVMLPRMRKPKSIDFTSIIAS